MDTITWLHLSDFHFRSSPLAKWNSDIVLKALLEDVKSRMSEDGLKPDIIFVTGDISFSSTKDDYTLAKEFFDDLLELTCLDKSRLLIIPGNHDVDRLKITSGAKAILSTLTDNDKVTEFLIEGTDRKFVFRKFENYISFINEYLDGSPPFNENSYYYVQKLDLSGHNLAILGLNSAWAAYGDKSVKTEILGEKQVRSALGSIDNSDLIIVMLHHPFEWLLEFDGEKCETLLLDKCNFILSGHLHKTHLEFKETPDGKALFISAGACFETRNIKNCYNFVRLDLSKREGTIFLRAWNNTGAGFWAADVQTYKNAKDGVLGFNMDEYRFITEPGKDNLQTIENQFNRITKRAVERISNSIPGLQEPIPRDEVSLVEAQLAIGKSVVLTGEAGTGKSGIASELAKSSIEKGQICLFLDARSATHIQDESQLRGYFDLNEPIHEAIKKIGRFKKLRFVIDQLDNIVGTKAADILTSLVKESVAFEGVEAVVISRKRESHEAKLLEGLTKAGFVEITSKPLSIIDTTEILTKLGISNPSEALTDLCCNLLNLSLIGKIKEQKPTFDLSSLIDEVDLWDKYIMMLLDREALESSCKNAEQMISEAVRLARDGLKNENRTFSLDYPQSKQQQRLISWGIILIDDRIGRFYHEKLQDYFVAWDATQRKLMPADVLGEIDTHRARNVVVWMDKICRRKDKDFHTRFMKEAFDVR